MLTRYFHGPEKPKPTRLDHFLQRGLYVLLWLIILPLVAYAVYNHIATTNATKYFSFPPTFFDNGGLTVLYLMPIMFVLIILTVLLNDKLPYRKRLREFEDKVRDLKCKAAKPIQDTWFPLIKWELVTQGGVDGSAFLGIGSVEGKIEPSILVWFQLSPMREIETTTLPLENVTWKRGETNQIRFTTARYDEYDKLKWNDYAWIETTELGEIPSKPSAE